MEVWLDWIDWLTICCLPSWKQVHLKLNQKVRDMLLIPEIIFHTLCEQSGGNVVMTPDNPIPNCNIQTTTQNPILTPSRWPFCSTVTWNSHLESDFCKMDWKKKLIQNGFLNLFNFETRYAVRGANNVARSEKNHIQFGYLVKTV